MSTKPTVSSLHLYGGGGWGVKLRDAFFGIWYLVSGKELGLNYFFETFFILFIWMFEKTHNILDIVLSRNRQKFANDLAKNSNA